ncbi:hypothetical protein GCM10010178_37000 [Lentzea flava]|uniref:Lysis protein n=2 Tax=Lentzea flava TaxID=103732 RepID=A0ABQ2UL78_9PSEU|nr:hypothetical protein [Lentzea flava]GGU41017.1 hypothetical protein GCM10010178_37000 [Lentzea flava]
MDRKLSAMTLALIVLVLAGISLWLDRHRDRNSLYSGGLAGSTDVTDRDRIRVRDELRYLT